MHVNAAQLMSQFESLSPSVTAREIINFSYRRHNPIPHRIRGVIRTFPLFEATRWFVAHLDRKAHEETVRQQREKIAANANAKEA